MIIVKAFTAEDYAIIYKNPIDESAWEYTPEQIREIAEFHVKGGCGFTGWLGDIPLGSLGVDEVRPGVGHMWALLHEEVRNHIKDSMRAVRRMLDIVERTYDFKKLRSESRIGFPESQRFLEFLGFERGRRTIMNNTHFFYRKILCHQ